MKMYFFPLLVSCLSLLLFLPAQATAQATNHQLRLVVIGDSTVCNYPTNGIQRGWGQYLQGYFTEDVTVLNLAKSGRSTKTFIQEGLWQKALAEKPDVVLIQFGHNDSHSPGKPEATDARTDYREYLRRYIDDARAIHSTPILITPMVRRDFGHDGTLKDNLQLYADAMKQVAAEKHVPVIDLHASSRRLVESLGPTASEDMASKPGDNTHFNARGAKAMAGLVMQQLPAADPVLASHLREQN
jgi:lysophospholipase L1-like esterase